MAYEIIHLSETEIAEKKQQFPQGDPKPFAVVEKGYKSMTLAYCDTVSEANQEVLEWEGRDILSEKIEEFLYEMIELGKGYHLDADEVRKMVHNA